MGEKHTRGSFTKLLACVVLILTSTIWGVAVSGAASIGLSIIPAQSGTTWEILNHEFLSEDIRQRDVVFVNATHGWVLSQKEAGTRQGMILYTNDSGDSWYQQYYNASQRFEQIEVIDSETLWVTGIGGLFHTENDGITWSRTKIGDVNDFFYAIHFFNRTHGWTSSPASMYKTTDSGQSWEAVDSWTFDDDWGRMIHFVSPLDGWVIGFLGMYHTEDGGATWEKEIDRGGWAMSFVSSTEAWAVADDWLAHMTDGVTWVEKPLPRTSLLPTRPPYFSDILFLDENNGWIVGDETEVAYTANGGKDWFSQSFPNDNRISAIDFINTTHGWAVGRDGYIYRTTRGNSLGTPLLAGLIDTLLPWIVGALAAIVIVISSVAVVRRRRQRIIASHHGAEIK
jgi:photosystem II stability/assembly factor-like uncharacterized protein